MVGVKTRHQAAWDRAEIPPRYAGLRLAGSPQARLYPDLVRRLTAPSTQADIEERGWGEFWMQSWFLWGPAGRGKSGLAAGYAYQWVDPAYGDPAEVVWHGVPQLLLSLRETYARRSSYPPLPRGRTEGEILRRCREADLLVLDDLGAEHVSGSGWVEDRLYQIVADRHAQMAPLFVTSNLSLAELKERIGERVVWRIYEMCGEANIVWLDGPNLREERAG